MVSVKRTVRLKIEVLQHPALVAQITSLEGLAASAKGGLMLAKMVHSRILLDADGAQVFYQFKLKGPSAPGFPSFLTLTAVPAENPMNLIAGAGLPSVAVREDPLRRLSAVTEPPYTIVRQQRQS
ncbi:hypothetical protein FZEAL_6205 [Fusarium zealandicum]|uniref:Uncharacterized protein n=1 Tax=Fusarium zealandicum TaxID=1053134 RepID=A0A8H4UIA6_9HYPO|nr:hypothetical protein FZEAL_6205 [Fusarium zealandicum]